MTNFIEPMLLLHVCCAPCAAGCVERLLAAGREVRLYYSNSNINTVEEFERRLASVERLAGIFALKLEIDPYDHKAWAKAVAGYEPEPERGKRCTLCFARSLGQTARRAKELNANFATTLTVSPHKSSPVIFEVGRVYDNFEAWDFKKQDGFKHGRELAKQHGFYLQNFCGCEYSL
ncbi:MAG: epoxyqueuosine reductase QueH [Victivallales bacterium]|nr:epoxyqueuosine reductase QueH [Victivallales bacterium]